MNKPQYDNGSVVTAVILALLLCAACVAGIAVTSYAVKAYTQTEKTE